MKAIHIGIGYRYIYIVVYVKGCLWDNLRVVGGTVKGTRIHKSPMGKSA